MEIDKECQPIERRYLELLQQEYWQAYLDYLRDRVTWGIEAQTENPCACDGEIGPVSFSTDPCTPGTDKVSITWKPTKRRDLSLFQLGLRLLDYLVTQKRHFVRTKQAIRPLYGLLPAFL